MLVYQRVIIGQFGHPFAQFGVPRVGFHENCREKVFTDLGSDQCVQRIGLKLNQQVFIHWMKTKIRFQNICLEKKKTELLELG